MADYQSIFTGQEIDERLSAVPNKVDKVTGKGLSTNDYTTDEKTKLTALPTAAEIAASIAAKYTRPSGGIPSSDLAAAVVASLNNGDNAAAGVTAINDKIPAQATSSNKLADKDFVNSSINSVTAYYITADASGNAFATKAALLVGPYYNQGEIRVPTRNDYALVNADESHDNAAVRYVYDGTAWVYQYKVNDTPFTAAQLAAINSGITAELVAKIHDREIFVATYDATTYAEITAALAAGKFVILMTGSTRGYLSYIENGAYYFSTTTSYIYMWKVTSADVWSTIVGAQIETTNHRVTTLSAQSTDNDYPTAKCVYDAAAALDAAKANKVVLSQQVAASVELAPNTLYKWGVMTALAVSLATPVEASIENEYKGIFVSGSTPTAFSYPSTIVWAESNATDEVEGVIVPSIEANATYEFSILEGKGIIIKY